MYSYMAAGTFAFTSKKKGSRCISAFKRNKMLQLEIIKRSNITFKIIKLNDLVVGISFRFFLYISILHCFIDYLIICVLKKTMKIELSPSYLFKINNRNTRKGWEICSKLTLKTPERRRWRCSGVFIVNFEHISHLFLMFLLLKK